MTAGDMASFIAPERRYLAWLDLWTAHRESVGFVSGIAAPTVGLETQVRDWLVYAGSDAATLKDADDKRLELIRQIGASPRDSGSWPNAEIARAFIRDTQDDLIREMRRGIRRFLAELLRIDGEDEIGVRSFAEAILFLREARVYLSGINPPDWKQVWRTQNPDWRMWAESMLQPSINQGLRGADAALHLITRRTPFPLLSDIPRAAWGTHPIYGKAESRFRIREAAAWVLEHRFLFRAGSSYCLNIRRKMVDHGLQGLLEEPPIWYEGHKEEEIRAIFQGLHPTGRPIRPAPESKPAQLRCSDCLHFVRRDKNRCASAGRAVAPDWPACSTFFRFRDRLLPMPGLGALDDTGEPQ